MNWTFALKVKQYLIPLFLQLDAQLYIKHPIDNINSAIKYLFINCILLSMVFNTVNFYSLLYW